MLAIFTSGIVESEWQLYHRTVSPSQSMWNSLGMVETKIFQLLCDLYSTMTELNIDTPDVHVDLIGEGFYIPSDRVARFRRDYIVLEHIKKVMVNIQKQLRRLPSA